MSSDEAITVDAAHEPGSAEAVVRVSGELDAGTAPVLAAELERVIGAGATELLVDLGDVAFIDSTGLTTLISARTQVEGRGRLSVVAASAPVRRVFDVTGLADLFAAP
ncbi:MAG: STAS domain-containing protein [Actinomycetota bacterium]|nr:STAS domain-containing protein [Acidimicrobiia bacterium]MDQ3294158.1 STAS domain-containing protein [Actinomycetota bacterium]